MTDSFPREAPQWTEIEIRLQTRGESRNPYTDFEVWADFTGPDGTVLRRPAFWDGGQDWVVRFASPVAEGTWSWVASARPAQANDLDGCSGTLRAVPATGHHAMSRHGFLRMSPGGRNLIDADGHPFLLVADTPWALPYRATPDQVTTYARDRQAKGFNAALLMTVQPDMKISGPRNRTEDGAFEVGFDDLPEGTLKLLQPDYFQKLDRLISILVEHDIVPVVQPVFHGFGWKGGDTAGGAVSPEDYTRYCRYLVARYGARRVIWLVGADGSGREPGVEPGGREIETWDAYGHPTGIHYNPWQDNGAWHDAAWLDFQWCQTGHGNEHRPEKVSEMFAREPAKGIANGEPTYERINRPDFGAGWWQGHEAWLNLTSGGTMGIVYGAAGLWQWKLRADEPGWAPWCDAKASWEDALAFEGSRYAGLVGRILDGYDLADCGKRIDIGRGRRTLAVPDRFILIYAEHGGNLQITHQAEPLPYRIVDPKTGGTLSDGSLPGGGTGLTSIDAPSNQPIVFVAGHRASEGVKRKI
jgi:hypothetical protein